MKKLISVLLAVSALALSTSAFAAAPTVSSRNEKATAFAEATAGTLPCFRNGDTVTFTLSGVTGTVTLLSSKADATSVDNNSIQYINQYTKDSDNNVSVTYKIRELTNGTYKLLIKDGEATVAEYYYNVANPTANVLTTANGSTTLSDDGNGKLGFGVVVSTNGASFADSGAGMKFTLTDENNQKYTQEYTGSWMNLFLGTEVGGNANVFYGLEVTGASGHTITPSVEMNK